MKKIFLLSAFMFITVASFSQDVITYIQGATIEALVTRVSRTQIQFRLFTEPRGKEYYVYIRDIANIKYRDGRIETFNPTVGQNTESIPRENTIANQQIINSNTNPTINIRNQADRVEKSNQSDERRIDNTQRINENESQQIRDSNTSHIINNWNQTYDIIQLRSGGRIIVNVLEITPNQIKYRDYDNPNGAIYTIHKSDVTKIIFQNGKEETFTHGRNSLGNNYNQNNQQFFFGLGFGLDYGGFGGKIEYLPVKYFGIYGGLGYNLLSAGWNVGATFKTLPDQRVSPNLMIFYGYNGITKVAGFPNYNMTSYGVSFGINFDIRIGSKGNKWSIGLYAPIRSQKFKDNYDAMKSDKRIEMLNSLLPIAGGIGYNFIF